MTKSSRFAAAGAFVAVFYIASSTGYPLFALRSIDRSLNPAVEMPLPEEMNAKPEPIRHDLSERRARSMERRKQATAILFYHLIGLLGSKQL